MSVAGMYNPIDFAWWATADASDNRIEQVLNQKSLGLGTNEKWTRVGVVSFDFYEIIPDVIFDIVRSNRGCGGLQRES